MGTYELLFLNNTKDYATVHSVVEMSKKLDKKSTSFINAILRKVIKFRENGSYEKFKNDENIPLNIKYSFPEWLVEKLQSDFKNDAESLLRIFNENPLQMIRIANLQKRNEIISELKEVEILQKRK